MRAPSVFYRWQSLSEGIFKAIPGSFREGGPFPELARGMRLGEDMRIGHGVAAFAAVGQAAFSLSLEARAVFLHGSRRAGVDRGPRACSLGRVGVD